MVSISNIPNPTTRFLPRDRLEEIKNRIQRVPLGTFWMSDNLLFCTMVDDNGNKPIHRNICNVLHPGVVDAFLHMKNDMDDLIRHVEEADKENDALIERIKELEGCVSKTS